MSARIGSHERAVAWFRAFLHAVRSGDDALRRLAQRELRVLGVAVVSVPSKDGAR